MEDNIFMDIILGLENQTVVYGFMIMTCSLYKCYVADV